MLNTTELMMNHVVDPRMAKGGWESQPKAPSRKLHANRTGGCAPLRKPQTHTLLRMLTQLLCASFKSDFTHFRCRMLVVIAIKNSLN